MYMKARIFIPYNVPSSKNSKVWTGRFLVNSKTTAKYIKNTKEHWEKEKEAFLKMLKGKSAPYNIALYFKRDSLRRFDLINATQILFDLMQEYEWIEDDSAYIVTPVYEGFCIDREDPGVFIYVK
jgi:hypothetical protein